MDHTKFADYKTGRLVGIKVGGRHEDFAFIPNPLPERWAPSDKLWPIIAEARDIVGRLSGTGTVLPNPALLLRPLQRREAIKSNTIEGTFVTPQELLLFEAGGEKPRESSEKQKDWEEILHYEDTLLRGRDHVVAGGAIDRELMCSLHATLLAGERGKNKHPGVVRDTQVYVEAGGRYIPPPPDELDELIANLEWYLSSPAGGDPLVRAYIGHYQFESIHPFRDGNGRIGRILLSLTLQKWLNHAHPWLYMSEFFEKHRKEYINRLFAVSAEGEWEEWVRFCLLGTIEHATAALARCSELANLKQEYEERVGHASGRMNWIISRLFKNPIIEISELARELGIDYKTAKSDMAKLVDAAILEELKDFRPRTYVAWKIFRAAYE